jgi:serine/threonine protein kinase/formylglycine-generating enzyme required for sulfatase activity
VTPERWAVVKRLFDELACAAQTLREVRLAELAREDSQAAELLTRMLREHVAAPETTVAVPPTERASNWPELSEYSITRYIGSGGMGVVYAARQLSLGRTVALKVLRDAPPPSQREVDRFRREAMALARLRHPGIVSIFDVGTENGRHFFSMDMVEGADLAAVLKALRDGTPPPVRIPPFGDLAYIRTIAEIGAALADALQTAHEHSIIHRDIKPSNVLMTPEGKPMLVDFGIARDESLGAAATLDLAGTPQYMSPEQLRARLDPVDARTDVYSLGVVLYESLTLSLPYSGASSIQVASRILSGESPQQLRKRNPRVPEDLATIVHVAMAARAADRYPTAAALRDDLRRFLSFEAILARKEGLLERLRRAIFRQRHLICLAFACLGIALGSSMWTRDSARAHERSEFRGLLQNALADDLTHRTPSELARISALVTGYSSDRLGSPPPELDILRRRLEAYRTTALHQARADIEAGRAGGDDADRQLLLLRGLRRIVDLRLIFPASEELQRRELAEDVNPVLDVDARDALGRALGATVWVQDIDTASTRLSAPRLCGKAPLRGYPLAPGYYRVTIEFDTGGGREFATHLALSNMRETILAVGRADEAAIVADMICVPGGEFIMPDAYRSLPFGGHRLVVETFFLDSAEVSNGEYRAFIEATGHRRPKAWDEIGANSANSPAHGAFDDLPVTNVSWEDARDFAEWAGKRLPTLAEFLYAAGVGTGRRHPWPEDAGATPRGNVCGTIRPDGADMETLWAWYLQNVFSVRSCPDAATPSGLLHMYGNVSEWTETMAVNTLRRPRQRGGSLGGLDDQMTVPAPWNRYVVGAAWDAVRKNREMTFIGDFGISALHSSFDVGFRCAKSATQPDP